jgi:hypothetical protein
MLSILNGSYLEASLVMVRYDDDDMIVTVILIVLAAVVHIIYYSHVHV